MKKTLTIRLPDDLRKELEQISRSTDKPASDIVRESLRRYLTLIKFRRLRNKVLPYAEARGLFTDEDVFNIVS